METKEMRQLQTRAESVKVNRPGGTEMQRIRLPARRPLTGDGQGRLSASKANAQGEMLESRNEMTLCGDKDRNDCPDRGSNAKPTVKSLSSPRKFPIPEV